MVGFTPRRSKKLLVTWSAATCTGSPNPVSVTPFTKSAAMTENDF